MSGCVLKCWSEIELKVLLRQKKTPVYFNWNFRTYSSALANFKILRELGRGENDVNDSLV